MNESSNITKAQPARVAEGVPEQRRADETTVLPRVSVPPRPDEVGIAEPLRREPPPPSGPRRASFTIVRVGARSVFRLVALVGVTLFVLWMIGILAMYAVLARLGVLDKLNGTLGDLLKGSGHDARNIVDFGNVVIFGAVTGLLDVALVAVFAATCVHAYNSCSELAGGLELTLAERSGGEVRPQCTRRD